MNYLKQKMGPKRLLSKRMLVLLVANLFAIVSLYAQQRTVTGNVTDPSGETLVGVNIVVKGTTLGTATDMDGNYSISVSSDDAILTVNYIGYKMQEVPVSGKSTLNIVLERDVQDIDEVVVVGYGVQKKKLVTGATTQIKSEEFTQNNVNRIESALQGLTPGMSIVKQSGQPGADFNITIRGLSSINGNSPLVLIDGVPGSLNMLNPSDIESIDVLKDAASAAIYGSRAANGVILVTTKKGKKGEAQVVYDAYFGFSNLAKKIDLLGAKDYATIMNEAMLNTNPKIKKLPFTDEYINSLGEGTDWIEEALNQNAPSQSHYIGISGGTEKSIYSMSVSYDAEEGIFNFEDKSKYERLGFRLNSEHQVKDYLKIGENLTFNHRKSKSMATGNQYVNFLFDLIGASPIIDAYDPNQPDGFGKGKTVDENGQNGAFDGQGNPLADMHYKYNGINNYDDFIGDIYAEIQILPGLKFRTDFGATLNFNNFSDHQDTFQVTLYDYNIKADYIQSMSRNFNYNWDNVLSYEKSFGKHHGLAMVGMNAQDGKYFNMYSKREGKLSNTAMVLNNVDPDTILSSYVIEGDFGENDSRSSIFGRISYDYDEKYLATVSLRRDGSSRFGQNYRYGYFPAVSAGWVMTKEEFMNDVTWLDFLKLRASWGQNGKEPADQFVYMAQVGNENRPYSFGGAEQQGVSPILFANPDLKWEASTQANIGFDSHLFEDFRLTFDWYNKSSKDWIMQAPVAGISGIAGVSTSNPYLNAGNVKNSGVELDLGYQKNIGDLHIELGANVAYNKNIVTSVPDSIIHGSGSVLFNACPEFYRVQEGMPMGFFWGYKIDGIFQTEDEITSYLNPDGKPYYNIKATKPGDVIRRDINGDGKINDDDKVFLGDPNPDFIFGFRLNATFKGFDLSMNIQGQTGNQIVKSYRAQERYYANYTTDILDRWQWVDSNNNGVVDQGEGTSTTRPRVTTSEEGNANWIKFSDLYVHDGDYVKIKSLNVGYDLKKSLLKHTDIQKFRVYVAATNLLTITKYDGWDPEIGYGGTSGDKYASGIDAGFYPSARTFLFGFNVTF